MRSTWVTLATASLALSTSRAADACSPPPCIPGAFVPGDQARVPANLPALYWRPMWSYGVAPDPDNVVLASAAAPTTPIGLTAHPLPSGHFLLVPDAPLVEGSSYVLTDRSVCEVTDERGPQVTFSVGPAAPLPSELGPLVEAASGIMPLNLATSSGSCFAEATVAQASIELAPSAVANPWIDALHFETLVDGKPWSYATSIGAPVAPGASPTGRGRDRVFQVCASEDPTVQGLPAGPHVVTMRATLPGTTQTMMSSSLTVALTCDPPGEPDHGGCSAAGVGAAPWLFAALVTLVTLVRRSPRSRRTRSR